MDRAVGRNVKPSVATLPPGVVANISIMSLRRYLVIEKCILFVSLIL